MDQAKEPPPAEQVRHTVHQLGDEAAALARECAPLKVHSAGKLYAAYRAALARPDVFASARSRAFGDVSDLAERSIRAELALALGVSERVASREIDRAILLEEGLPVTKELLLVGGILWEAGALICDVGGDVPRQRRGEYDWRAADLARELTPTQLRKPLARLREELQIESLTVRHEAARERRAVWVTPDCNGMAVLSALLPAHLAMGAYNRMDRIARSLRSDEAETRTLAQLRADACADILTDGDITGTTPDGGERVRTFLPGVRANVRITVPVLTATGHGEQPAELDGYGPIPADIARELVGTGSAFYRVLTDPVNCQLISVERLHRFAPDGMRVYIEVRDLTCRFPGCIRPASRADLDHAREWAKGGHTSIDNLLALCVGHHHVRHGEQWTYRMHGDGTAEWTSPTGRQVTTRPPEVPGATTGPRFREEVFPEEPPPLPGPTPF
ncbi:DUF222 domain-containing protein [Microbacteriaceae bacterium VKM Ac-2854]|nr:DUF222 domain-containing protein [Microbacteriaceae bacterium VKM Ac-2854]